MEESETAANGVGLVSCACWNDHATLTFKKCGFLFVCAAIFSYMGIFGAYITTVARDMMPAFLPLISNAAGEPPSMGIFAVFSEIGLFFVILGFMLLYVSINHRNVRKNKLLKLCNLVCFIFVCFAWIGLIMTVCNPVGYTDLPNKFEWVVTVLYGHAMSATLILVGLFVFQFFFAVMWWFLQDTTKIEKLIKLSFIVVYLILGLIILYPLPIQILEVLDYRPFDYEYMKTVPYSLPREYSTAFMIVSVCEWIICILSILNIGTHGKDLQRVSCRLVFRHKSCLADDPIPLIAIPSA